MGVDKSQGRWNQKRRTRIAILKSAAELLQAGTIPAVAEAAEAAGVSRATAYRYFPTQDLLLTEAGLQAATPAIEQLLASSDFPQDVEQRLERLIDAVYDMLFANERAFMALLRLSLEPLRRDSPPRGGRRLAWLEIALSPVRNRFGPAEFKALVASLAVFLGVECVVVLRDVCALPPAGIRHLAQNASRTILRAALLPKTPTGSARAGRSSAPSRGR